MKNNNERFWFSISDQGIIVHDEDTQVCICGQSNLGASYAAIIAQALNNELKQNPNLIVSE